MIGLPSITHVPSATVQWEVVRPQAIPASVDLEIRFLRAEGIPTADVVTPFGVYFEADLEGRLSYA